MRVFNDRRVDGRACLGVFVLMASLLSCGKSTTQPLGILNQLTLEVTPDSTSVLVGGTAQFSVVARDITGKVVTAPAVSWTSTSLTVATISSSGLATGFSPGQTFIVANSGGVVSSPAELDVEPAICDGILAQHSWHANLDFIYSDRITTPDGIRVTATHFATVAATLTPAGPVFNTKFDWTGPLVSGPAFNGVSDPNPVDIEETSDNQVSDPTEVGDLSGEGPPIPTPGVDGFRLEVDLSNCTYQFYAAPSVHTTLKLTEHAIHVRPGPDEGTRVSNPDMSLGIVQKGITPLGAWRTAGLGDFTQLLANLTAYSLASAPTTLDAYIPSGYFGTLAFYQLGGRVSKWEMYYRITPIP